MIVKGGFVHVAFALIKRITINRYFQDKNMDWKCVLDRSACTYNEIFSSENRAVIFAPEAKTRQWLYKKEMQAVSIPKYYLDFAEYNEGKLDKIAIFFMEYGF